jgi:glucuronoarabinoxylan endo-1,4-beta-xylanase
MKRILLSLAVLLGITAVQAAKPRTSLIVYSTKKQAITGFGGACCDGAMCPYGSDTKPVKLLYGAESKIGLNIMRMEISPNFIGDVKVPEWGNWDSPYDWNGSLPSAKIVKQRGGIVFGTPWSPPGEYKTNGSAQGGNADDQGNVKGKLREDCYEKFFPWLNTFLKWMKEHGVVMDAVSIQNEPDWWVSYSGCLYEPEEQVNLVKNYAHLLDRETYGGVRIISAEPLGFAKSYYDALVKDKTCREQVDIFAGHIYGHMPLQYIKPVAKTALPLGKEIWMTEHSTTDNTEALPTWNDNLIFAEELNECMLAGCTGYIYWYMRAHWAFVGTGESKYGTENKKNELLPRAFVMSHFSKNVTGSTRLQTSLDEDQGRTDEGKLANYEFSAYTKGDSIIVMAINAAENARDLKITLPYNVKSGKLWLSTGNETEDLCQQSDLDITESIDSYLYEMPAKSLNTFIFKVDNGSTAIENVNQIDEDDTKTYYDLHGRRLDTPHGLCIERSANGKSRKVMM